MAEIEFSGAVVLRLAGLKRIRAEGQTLGQVLQDLETRLPVLKGSLVSGQNPGKLYFIYVDGKDVRLGGGLDMPVGENTVIRIMNALTGG